MDTAYVSEPHRLIVHEHPEDGFEILHPDSCLRRDFTEETESGDPVATYVAWDCAVAWHVDSVGLDWTLWHGFNPDDEAYRFTEKYVLLPGTYTLRVEVVKTYAYEFGAYEYDSIVWVEPQAAITSGVITAPGGWCAPDPRDWSAYVEDLR